jgi:hypothetical protein
MPANFMYGREIGEQISGRICWCCQREVLDGRRHAGFCFECFEQWYDGNLPHPDNLDPVKIANYVRSKHHLAPLTAEQVERNYRSEYGDG